MTGGKLHCPDTKRRRVTGGNREERRVTGGNRQCPDTKWRRVTGGNREWQRVTGGNQEHRQADEHIKADKQINIYLLICLSAYLLI